MAAICRPLPCGTARAPVRVAGVMDHVPTCHRSRLEERWFELTRALLPGVAVERGWPVRLDHCFQRILLDAAVGAAWRTVIRAPAWRNAEDAVLARAVALGEAVLAGEADLASLNRASLRWRGKLRADGQGRAGKRTTSS